jgi:hypothetical protein
MVREDFSVYCILMHRPQYPRTSVASLGSKLFSDLRVRSAILVALTVNEFKICYCLEDIHLRTQLHMLNRRGQVH